jgi:energy-coupling factor transporter ATP-binding protein EcfA2
MRLSSFNVENYKSFSESIELKLRPITLLYGYNSVGKSALLRALALISDSISEYSSSPINLRSPSARNAQFNNLLCQLDSSPTLKIGLSWADVRENVLGVYFEITELADRKRQVISKFRIEHSPSGGKLTATWAPYPDIQMAPNLYSVEFAGAIYDADLEFSGLLPLGNVAGLPGATQMIQMARNNLRELGISVHWLGAFRALPQRIEPFIAPPIRLGVLGENAGQALAYDKVDGGELRDNVSSWFQSATGNRLLVEETAAGASPAFSLKLVPEAGAPVRVDLADTGEGMGQVLPVLVLAGLASQGKLGHNAVLTIEHPELHLQPAAHATLAEYLIKQVGGPFNPTLIVETHSENLLLRIQLAIAKGELSPDSVALYWVRQLDNGASSCELIEFDDLGRPASSWPPGVFTTNLEQSRNIIKARKERG